MRLRDALRRAAGYHLRALPPTALGLGLAGGGVWYGLDGGTSLAAVTAGRLAPTAALVAAGVAVTAVGRTAVRLDATADAVAASVDGAGVDEDDLRETVALATERAVADSVEGATAEMEARVAAAVEEAVADANGRTDGASGRPVDADGRTADAGGRPAGAESTPTGTDTTGLADALDAGASEPDALADATKRASERVESYLESEDADVGEFRQLAEGAAVLDDEGSAAPDSESRPDRSVVRTGDAAPSDGPAEERAADDPTGGTADDDSTEGRTAADDARANDGAEILDDDPDDPDLPDGDTDVDDAEILDDDTEMVFGDVRDSGEGERRSQ